MRLHALSRVDHRDSQLFQQLLDAQTGQILLKTAALEARNGPKRPETWPKPSKISREGQTSAVFRGAVAELATQGRLDKVTMATCPHCLAKVSRSRTKAAMRSKEL